MRNHSILARLQAAERHLGVDMRIGLAIVETLIACESRDASDVVAIEVGHGERLRIDRRPGESLADLEQRANPRGCWRSSPAPIYSSHRAAA